MTLALIVGSTEIDLLEGGDGYRLRLDGWVPQVAKRNQDGSYENPVEAITLRAEGVHVSALSGQIRQDFEDTIRKLQEWLTDPVAPDRVWLRWQLPNTTSGNEHQALVRDLTFERGNSPFFPPTQPYGASDDILAGPSIHPALQLAIERHPFWESLTGLDLYYYGLASGGANALYGGTIKFSGNIAARISRTSLSEGNFTEVWWGFRTERYGPPADFQPVWPLSSATYNNGAAWTGSIASWTPSDTTLLERMYVTMDDAGIGTVQRDAQRGTHLVLLRARSSSSTRTYYVRLSDGFSGGTSSLANWNTRSRVEVSGTSWAFYPLGTVTIPPLSLKDTGVARALLGDYTLRIEAQEGTTDVSGALQMERLVLIPQSEGFCHLKGIYTGSAVSSYVYCAPDDVLTAVSLYTNGNVVTPDELDVVNYAYPPEGAGARLVFAGTSSGDAALTTPTDSLNMTLTLYRRWLS